MYYTAAQLVEHIMQGVGYMSVAFSLKKRCLRSCVVLLSVTEYSCNRVLNGKVEGSNHSDVHLHMALCNVQIRMYYTLETDTRYDINVHIHAHSVVAL